MFFGIQNTNYTYTYLTEPSNQSCNAFRDNRCHWPRGKMIGGTGGINGMIYVRGNRFDYDRWLAEGNAGWGFDDVWPYFEKSIRPLGNETHPQGYVALNEFPRFDNDIFAMIFQGSAELGMPRVKDFVEGSYIGYSHLKGTIANSLRASTGRTYLGRVSQRPNLTVIKNAQVTKLVFDRSGQSVQTVEFLLRQQHLKVKVKREVILSAGTIDSAKLLMLSGVGPEQKLQHLNIPVKHNLPIGENLQDHVIIQLYFRLRGAEPNRTQVLDSIYQYLMYKRGPFASHGSAALTGFINTNTTNGSPYPDMEFHHFINRRGDIFGLNMMLDGFRLKDEFRPFLIQNNENYDTLVIFALLAHPKSVGDLSLNSSSPQDPPVINANYLSHPDDVEVLLRAMKYIMKLEQSQAFREKQVELLQIPLQECNQFNFKSDDYWRCYFKYFSTSCYHHVGTVKMGPQADDRTCVNPRLKLKGVYNVRIVDASIMPHLTSGNTNAPTIMIAEKASDMIKADWSQICYNPKF